MKHLEQYYRNLSEQLERQIAILEAKLKDKKKDNKGKKEKLADKDYDKDGELETSKEEHKGAVDNAIKKAIAKKKGVLKEGREFSTGNIVYGGFPKVMNENQESYLVPSQSIHNSGALSPQKPTNLSPMDNNGNGIHDTLDAITWNAKAYGTPYPSESFAAAASAAIAAGDVVGKLHDKARTAMGPNYQQKGFLQDPTFLAAREKQLAAEAAMKAHPHYAEAQKGHPSTRRGPLTPAEQSALRGYGEPGSGSRWTGD